MSGQAEQLQQLMEYFALSGSPVQQQVARPTSGRSDPSLAERTFSLIDTSHRAPRGGVPAGFTRFAEQA
ncbi:hypothetical protein RCF34_04385 [Pseudomonas sp. 102515]|uniref:hypothetical protein n=1 Tax=Pseudomonas sp. 102515 TaxID=3071568 RepID=UPI002802E4FD|nr:hypothetical protein [Pseudomonas sp. 102515]MDQ7912345.1 hypothetical protein [Pseudomonas sp. 102515]